MWTLRINTEWIGQFETWGEVLNYLQMEVDPYDAQYVQIRFQKELQEKGEFA